MGLASDPTWKFQLLETTLPTAAGNLALDEALLLEADRDDRASQLLRLWELPQHCVILGRGSRVTEEVDVSKCQQLGVPILRRSSGGGTVVAGPGCLMYSLIFNTRKLPQLKLIDNVHRTVLEAHALALTTNELTVQLAGTSDLAATLPGEETPRKFSGNSLRIKSHALLYHGTILFGMDLEFVSDLLPAPPRQPAYRAGRPHADFLMNLAMQPAEIRRRIIRQWRVNQERTTWPREACEHLEARKYSQSSWSLQGRQPRGEEDS